MTQQTTAVSLPANIEETFEKLDLICKDTAPLFQGGPGSSSFMKGLKLASAMGQMRAMLTQEVMRPIMELMNSSLGFRTDKDPNRPKWNPKTNRYEDVQPYAWNTVRECFIAASLRGLQPVNNEWNIIAEEMYATRNGLKRLCETAPEVSALKVNLGVPRLLGDKGAIVKVEASWRKNGTVDQLAAEIPVRVNASMGADAVIGKAERKMYKRILDRLTGSTSGIVDGEAEEAVEVESTKTPVFEGGGTSLFEEDQVPGAEVPQESNATAAPAPAAEPPPPKPAPPPHVPLPPSAPVAPPPRPPAPPIVPPAAPAAPSAAASDAIRKSVLQLRDMANQQDITEQRMVGWMVFMKLAAQGSASLEDVPHSSLLKVIAGWTRIAPKIKEYMV